MPKKHHKPEQIISKLRDAWRRARRLAKRAKAWRSASRHFTVGEHNTAG